VKRTRTTRGASSHLPGVRGHAGERTAGYPVEGYLGVTLFKGKAAWGVHRKKVGPMAKKRTLEEALFPRGKT